MHGVASSVIWHPCQGPWPPTDRAQSPMLRRSSMVADCETVPLDLVPLLQMLNLLPGRRVPLVMICHGVAIAHVASARKHLAHPSCGRSPPPLQQWMMHHPTLHCRCRWCVCHSAPKSCCRAHPRRPWTLLTQAVAARVQLQPPVASAGVGFSA